MRKEITDLVRLAKAKGQKIVVDIDDFFEGLDPSNRAYSATDPKLHPDNNRDHYIKMIYEADAVITSTPFLYNYYAAKRNNVFLVRNGIDIDRWRLRKDKAKRSPVVGWVGATPWRSKDLESLNPYVPKFLKKHNLTFHHSGHTPEAPFAYEQIGYHRQKSTIMPMAPILDYPKLFPPIDVGLVPLNNLEFNHAKSFIKGLEYAAAGVPFISSYSPEYQYLADAGVGRIANTPEEWTYHLTELLDPLMRQDDAMVNYEIVKEKFSMEMRGIEWNEVMEKISTL
jgi:glycosyltransferase involved in cell wall biosynthesis